MCRALVTRGSCFSFSRAILPVTVCESCEGLTCDFSTTKDRPSVSRADTPNVRTMNGSQTINHFHKIISWLRPRNTVTLREFLSKFWSRGYNHVILDQWVRTSLKINSYHPDAFLICLHLQHICDKLYFKSTAYSQRRVIIKCKVTSRFYQKYIPHYSEEPMHPAVFLQLFDLDSENNAP